MPTRKRTTTPNKGRGPPLRRQSSRDNDPETRGSISGNDIESDHILPFESKEEDTYFELFIKFLNSPSFERIRIVFFTIFSLDMLHFLWIVLVGILLLHWIEDYSRDYGFLRPFADNSLLPTKQSHDIVAGGWELYNAFRDNVKDEQWFQMLEQTLNKITPGVVVSQVYYFVRTIYYNLIIHSTFKTKGFSDRVNITVNTLVKSDKNVRLQFEMRTIKEIGIEELIPNEAGKNALKTASADVSTKEEGPKHIDWEKRPCYGNKLLRRLFCFDTNRKKSKFCCCIPRFDGWLCGKTKETKSHCDPIIKLKSKDMKVKKFITDHITNILSEATTGKDFMGWAISSDTNYKSETFYWCLTYEQPIDNLTDKSEKDGKSLFKLFKGTETNRKFRILLAHKEIVDLAKTYKASDVFTTKPNDGFTKYCDRRWIHLKKMAYILDMKNATGNDPETKLKRDWGNTFFLDKLEVVMPKNSETSSDFNMLRDTVEENVEAYQNSSRDIFQNIKPVAPTISTPRSQHESYKHE